MDKVKLMTAAEEIDCMIDELLGAMEDEQWDEAYTLALDMSAQTRFIMEHIQSEIE